VNSGSIWPYVRYQTALAAGLQLCALGSQLLLQQIIPRDHLKGNARFSKGEQVGLGLNLHGSPSFERGREATQIGRGQIKLQEAQVAIRCQRALYVIHTFNDISVRRDRESHP